MPAARNAAASSRRILPHRARPKSFSRATATPHALKSLGESPKRPSIPAPDGPFMRTRRRWKRPDANGDNNSSDNNPENN